VSLLHRGAFWVFIGLLGSYAFYWQSRDWNSASRLMLTYALVDRGHVSIDGLQDQTGDRALKGGHYYSDKLPGFSFLGVGPYAVAKAALRLRPHPLGRRGFAYWPADYWITLGTSGIASALAGVILTALAADLGCGPRRSAMVGFAYGLATPAWAYATLSYGHQATACCLIGSFALLWRHRQSRRPAWPSCLAGFLAAAAATIELQVGPVSAILSLYMLGLVFTRAWPARAVIAFAAGALVPTLALLGYDWAAFGSPFDMGYFHEDLSIFRNVHGTGNPLGLRAAGWSRARDLLWGEYRGLFFYAPILVLAPLGWALLWVNRRWAAALVSLAVCVAVFLVNWSYPEWTGGWSTGPRLLLPLLPFGMLPVAACLATGARWLIAAAGCLGCAGAILMFGFVGAGARIPHAIRRPLIEAVLPAWRGDPNALSANGEQFARNLVSVAWPRAIARLSPGERWVQFVPLLMFQVATVVAMLSACRLPRGPACSRVESDVGGSRVA
jgi:hypothetical protein